MLTPALTPAGLPQPALTVGGLFLPNGPGVTPLSPARGQGGLQFTAGFAVIVRDCAIAVTEA